MFLIGVPLAAARRLGALDVLVPADGGVAVGRGGGALAVGTVVAVAAGVVVVVVQGGFGHTAAHGG